MKYIRTGRIFGKIDEVNNLESNRSPCGSIAMETNPRRVKQTENMDFCNYLMGVARDRTESASDADCTRE
jgi:hypothetical protein